MRVIDSRADPPGLAELRAALPGRRRLLETLDDALARRMRAACCSRRGLPYDLPLAVEARRRGLAVIGDIELFALAARAPVIAVTGSNGKSTVTTLASKMLESQGLRAPAGGNLGPARARSARRGEADAYVLEISSFQMETTDSLAPLAPTVLNVSADHLDRHGTLELYAELKEKLLAGGRARGRQRRRSARRGDGRAPCRASCRSRCRAELDARLLDRRAATASAGSRATASRCCAAPELKLRGTHNEANALAALALTAELTTDSRAALDVLRTFTGLPHRCQRVAERGGVTFIDDSKGTNVGATLAALQRARRSARADRRAA